MSEEEKEIILSIKDMIYNVTSNGKFSKNIFGINIPTKNLETLLNLLDKQQKELEEKCKKYVDLCFEAGKTKADLDIAERVIDKMAENIFTFIEDGVFVDDIEYLKLENETEVKEYFYKEIENE